MGIIARFRDIMEANFNALLDRAEDPEKMIDQYLRDLEEDLAKVKAETASVMAEETKAKRALDECIAEITKMQSYEERAVIAGNDQDAVQFLTKKTQLEDKKTGLQQAYDLAAGNAAKMRQMHDKLCEDMSSMRSRRDAIKAKIQVAKTQEKLNKLGASIEGAKGTITAFERMEAKANKMLDEANAMAELNKKSATGDVTDLMDKYENAPSAAIEDELAALKARLGK